eukprot:m.198075 g.198075  ORF g.198075 m.198075 type:complete len:775 (+) comp15714_c0_seq21:124-2448(+)
MQLNLQVSSEAFHSRRGKCCLPIAAWEAIIKEDKKAKSTSTQSFYWGQPVTLHTEQGISILATAWPLEKKLNTHDCNENLFHGEVDPIVVTSESKSRNLWQFITMPPKNIKIIDTSSLFGAKGATRKVSTLKLYSCKCNSSHLKNDEHVGEMVSTRSLLRLLDGCVVASGSHIRVPRKYIQNSSLENDEVVFVVGCLENSDALYMVMANFTNISWGDSDLGEWCSQKVKEVRETKTPLKTLPGLEFAQTALYEMLVLPFNHRNHFKTLRLGCPKGILLSGPPGVGKTLLIQTIAQICKATLVTIEAADMLGTFLGEIEEMLRDTFEKAIASAKKGPTILFIDEMDALCPRRRSGQTHENRIVAQFLTLLDGSHARGNLVVAAATNLPNGIDPALRRPGRLDREICISVPSRIERRRILELHTSRMTLHPNANLDIIAQMATGYVGADLASLAREAALCAFRRQMSLQYEQNSTNPSAVIEQVDFLSALKVNVASTQRGAENHMEQTTWSDIGGLDHIRDTLRQVVEWPLLFQGTFKRLGLQSPGGVVLHGPPGCAKTSLVRALANSCDASFISLNGAQIYSPYLGDAEHTIRDEFKRARQGAPSILFLDEIDALVGTRESSTSSGDVKERILSTILNEMDGIESATGVVVIGATNRIDCLDSAFLRPGRIDKRILVTTPNVKGMGGVVFLLNVTLCNQLARHEILKVHVSRMPCSNDVSLIEIANNTKGASGADLENICREAGLQALRENIDQRYVHMRHFLFALSEANFKNGE